MTRLSKSSIVVLVVFLLLLLPVPQAAAAGEVSNITKGLSYDGIQEAIDAADSGDIIELAAGTYAQTGTLAIYKALTLRGASGAAAVIEGDSLLDELISVESPGVVLEGLTIIGGHSKSITVDFDEVAFLAEPSIRSFSLLNCALEGGGSAGYAVVLYGTIENAEITFSGNTVCNFERRGLTAENAVEFIDSTVKVLDNNFANAGNYGIDLDAQASGTDFYVTGNTVTAEYTAVYLDDLLEGSSLTIKNNTLSSCDEAIYFSDDIVNSTVLIEGNSITSEEYKGIYFSYTIADSTVTIKDNTLSSGDEAIDFSYDIVNSTVLIEGNSIAAEGYGGVYFSWRLGNSEISISENTIVSGDGSGIDFDYELTGCGLTITDNVIKAVDNGFRIYYLGDSTATLQNNSFIMQPDEDYGYGIRISSQDDSKLNLLGNRVTGALTAVGIYDEGTESEITIAGNLFRDNGMGIFLGWYHQIDLAIAFNAFIGNEDDILFNSPAAPAALLNWWGAATGPTGLDEDITFAPWLAALIVAPDQAAGVLGENRTITARLQDSTGVLAETDLLAVRFTVTGAHSLTQVVPMVNGIAVLQYAGNPAGVDTITAEVLFAGETAGLMGDAQLTWEAKPEPEAPESDESGKELPRTSGSPDGLIMLRIIFLIVFAAALLHQRRTAAVK